MIETKKYTTIMSSILKEGKIGGFELIRKTIPKGKVLQNFNPESSSFYYDEMDDDFPIVVLRDSKEIWMSDSPMEQETSKKGVELAFGDVLTSGLGIGLFATLISQKEEVKSITIVELSPEVIELVFPQIKTPKMEVFNEDFFSFCRYTTKRFDFIYIDIWADFISAILGGERAKEQAKRCLKEGGVITYWLEEVYLRLKDKIKKGRRTMKGLTTKPCILCGKSPRIDYDGFCADCADSLDISKIRFRYSPAKAF